MYTLDFETDAIEDFAPLLPKPVGCSIRTPEGESHYYSWDHPTENNCTKEQFREVLVSIWSQEILTQNGCAFDIPIAEHWFGLPKRDPLLTHDTLFLSYLHDPHARSLSLKDLANDWLGIPPDDQQELYDWIMTNVPECKSRKKCGAYISRAPGGLAGKYANSDTMMTWELYQYVAPLVLPLMQEPYDRERKLAPIVAGMQNRGVRVDLERMRVDTLAATHKLHSLDAAVRHALGAPTLNPGSGAEVAQALQQAGYSNFLTTPTGKVATNKESLDQALEEAPELRELLRRRATYATLVGTFMLPYVDIADNNGDRLHPSYNQVRNPEGFGTRTGRLSSSKPNFQNQPSGRMGEEYPVIRSYFLPEEGHIWITGDFKNQEPRLAAHFEDGELCAAFNADPNLDPYMFVVDLVGSIKRTEAKVIFLGLLYAMGAAALADQLGCTQTHATTLRNIIKAHLTGLVQLDNDCKRRFSIGLPIRTLGGRQYHCEPPAHGRNWAYKALNILIQGSAADQNKEAMIYIYDRLLPGERIVGTVHDEISVSAPPERLEAIKAIMSEAANALPCDVPMLFDFGHGASWAEAK